MMSRSKSTPEDGNIFSAAQIQHQRVVIKNNYNENLVGILHETGSKEVVIVCHGYRSCKDRIPMVNLAVAFAIEGISAIRFDFAGNGDSEGSFQYGNYYREVDDLRAVIKYLEHEKRFVAAIIGHSKGGNVVLLYASRFNNVCNVVNISGRFDLKRGIEGRLGKDYLQRIKKYGFIDVANRKGNIEYRVTEESLMDRLTTNTSAACQLIPQSCRVLSIHGSADKIVPINDAMEFAKHILNHKLHIINGADHEYTCHQNELASVVLDFVKNSCSHDNAQAANKTTHYVENGVTKHEHKELLARFQLLVDIQEAQDYIEIPGAMYPKFPMITVWLDKYGSSNLAAPESATNLYIF